MSHAHDMKQLMRQVRGAGYITQLSSGGHWLVLDPSDRHLLVSASQTPSDYRSIRNTVAELRRAGVDLNGTAKRYLEDQPGEPRYTPPTEQDVLLARLNTLISELGADPNNPRSASKKIGPVIDRFQELTGQSRNYCQQGLMKLRRGEAIPPKLRRALQQAVDEQLAALPSVKPSADVSAETEEPETVPRVRSTPNPELWVRTLAAILDPACTRAEALTLAAEIRALEEQQ